MLLSLRSWDKASNNKLMMVEATWSGRLTNTFCFTQNTPSVFTVHKAIGCIGRCIYILLNDERARLLPTVSRIDSAKDFVLWKQQSFASCFHIGFLLGLFFYPDNWSDTLLRNVCWISTAYTALYFRRQKSSQLQILLLQFKHLRAPCVP
jgi:hypothetical protein